jgi:hypothetical protein
MVHKANVLLHTFSPWASPVTLRATVRPKEIVAVKEHANFLFIPHRHEQGIGHQAECENIVSAMLLLRSKADRAHERGVGDYVFAE